MRITDTCISSYGYNRIHTFDIKYIIWDKYDVKCYSNSIF